MYPAISYLPNMRTHVIIFWIPVFGYFGLTGGKPVPDGVKTEPRTDSTVGLCDSECTSQVIHRSY